MNVYLPLSEQLVVEPEAPLDDLLRGMETILMVEDEPLVLEFGRTALERFGYRVARHASEALIGTWPGIMTTTWLIPAPARP